MAHHPVGCPRRGLSRGPTWSAHRSVYCRRHIKPPSSSTMAALRNRRRTVPALSDSAPPHRQCDPACGSRVHRGRGHPPDPRTRPADDKMQPRQSRLPISGAAFCRFHSSNAGNGLPAPVGSAVFLTTTAAKRFGFSAPTRSPIRPPQSCPKNVTPWSSSVRPNRLIASTCMRTCARPCPPACRNVQSRSGPARSRTDRPYASTGDHPSKLYSGPMNDPGEG